MLSPSRKIKRPVIKLDNHSFRLPFFQSLTSYMALDFFEAGGIVRGIVYTLFAIVWFISFHQLYTCTPVDLFKDIRDDSAK